MKKMIYQNTRSRRKTILKQGNYKNFEYIILSLGTHPCAYICLTSESDFYKKNYDDIPIECHGGLTFAEDTLYNVLEYSDKYKCHILSSIERDWIIGWDYAHSGDYSGFFQNINDKKWTTEEIIEECKYVINQIIDYENNYKPFYKNGSDVTLYNYE